MPSILLPIIPGTLPPGVCFASEQERLVAFAEYMEAQLASGMAFYNYGESKPSVANQGYPWLRTTDMRWYFFSGSWKSPVNYDENERRLYVGTTVELLTYDGGDVANGPMWEVDTAFAGRSPMGPGLIPSSDPAKTLTVEEDYGAGSIEQTVAQMPTHNHAFNPPQGSDWKLVAFNDTFVQEAGSDSNASYSFQHHEPELVSLDDTGGGDPMSVVHPVRGCYVIKWTGRLYYIVP